MIYTAMLVLHIVIACATFGAITLSSFSLIKEKHQWFTKLAVIIAACAGLETVSGFMLAVLSPDITASQVGLHLVSYLSLCLIVEAALLLNTRRVWIG